MAFEQANAHRGNRVVSVVRRADALAAAGCSDDGVAAPSGLDVLIRHACPTIAAPSGVVTEAGRFNSKAVKRVRFVEATLGCLAIGRYLSSIDPIPIALGVSGVGGFYLMFPIRVVHLSTETWSASIGIRTP